MQPWTFVHAADIHLGSPRSYRHDPARNENWATAREQMAAMAPRFVLIGGDMTRDGDPHAYELQLAKDDFETLPCPCFAVPGNVEVGNKHTPLEREKALDTQSDKLARFALYFGPINWTFVFRGVRVTGFYAGVAGSGLPEEEMFWHFMERLPRLPETRYHVAMMHYALFVNDIHEPAYDPSDRSQYGDWYNGIDEPHRGRILGILKAAKTDVVLSGHIHCRRPVEVVDRIRFYRTPSAGGRPQYVDRWPDGDGTLGFQRLDVAADGIEVTFVPIEPLSSREPVGPMGHFYTNDHAERGFPDPEYDHLLPGTRLPR